MPSGFTNRWLSKVLTKALWVGSGGMVLPTSTGGNVSVSQSQLADLTRNQEITTFAAASTMINSGIAAITASSAAIVMTLQEPVANAMKLLANIQVSSGIFFKSTGATFDGTNVVMKTTVAGQIVLRGLSTSRWLVESAFPGSTLAASQLTFSATT